MSDEEKRALGKSRRLVFHNLAVGVPPETVRGVLCLSEVEMDAARRFVGRKVTEHLVLRRQPPIPCDSVSEIRWNRRALLAVLAKIGDLDLSTDLILKLTVQSLDHPDMIEGAKHRMSEARA